MSFSILSHWELNSCKFHKEVMGFMWRCNAYVLGEWCDRCTCDRWFLNVPERALVSRSGTRNANPEEMHFQLCSLSPLDIFPSISLSLIFFKKYNINNWAHVAMLTHLSGWHSYYCATMLTGRPFPGDCGKVRGRHQLSQSYQSLSRATSRWLD